MYWLIQNLSQIYWSKVYCDCAFKFFWYVLEFFFNIGTVVYTRAIFLVQEIAWMIWKYKWMQDYTNLQRNFTER